MAYNTEMRFVYNCSWCNPPDGKGGRVGRNPLPEGFVFTDGMCQHHNNEMRASMKQLSLSRGASAVRVNMVFSK